MRSLRGVSFQRARNALTITGTRTRSATVFERSRVDQTLQKPSLPNRLSATNALSRKEDDEVARSDAARKTSTPRGVRKGFESPWSIRTTQAPMSAWVTLLRYQHSTI